MATRSIVTSQPDVACDVCERRLLRGEQSDVFLAGGQRRTVCELCAPRATHEGWLREADRHSVSLPSSRPRRGRNLLGRLRQLREPASRFPEEASTARPLEERESERYDFLDSSSGDVVDELSTGLEQEPPAGKAQGGSQPAWDREPTRPWPASEAVGGHGAVTGGDLKVERALEVFNAGEHPRRVAGVARSLGAPGVSIRPVADAGSVVAIMVAWELCWYRYEVDLGDEAAGAQVVAQGTELGELAEEDRLVNAIADEHGALSLSGA
jgi:hypothetical protein